MKKLKKYVIIFFQRIEIKNSVKEEKKRIEMLECSFSPVLSPKAKKIME